MTFEQALARLDEIVALLGDGNTSLEQSLAFYAEGAALIERCNRELLQAKQTIETLELQKGDESNGFKSPTLA